MNNWNSNSQTSQNWGDQVTDEALKIDNWDPSSISSNKGTATTSKDNPYASPPYREAYSNNYDQRHSQPFANTRNNSQVSDLPHNYNSLSNYHPVTLPQKRHEVGKFSTDSVSGYPSFQRYQQQNYPKSSNPLGDSMVRYQSSASHQDNTGSGTHYAQSPGYTYQQQNVKPAYLQNKPMPSNNLFSNPLNDPGIGSCDVEHDTRTEEQKLVENLHNASNKATSFSELRKPSGARISKSALAMLSKDLCEAALPFQSPETLKAFRDMNLGFTPETVEPISSTGLSDANAKTVTCDKRLSVQAKEFFPSTTVKRNDFSDDNLMVLTSSLINELIYDQSCFEISVPKFIDTLRMYSFSSKSVEKIVEMIYEACISSPDFRYHGSQLCHILSQPSSSLENFRRVLLKRAKSEFDLLDSNIRSSDEKDVTRSRNLSLFMAELFDKLMVENENGELKRLTVLGKAITNIIEKLIALPNDGNVMTAGKIIKLTILNLQESLKSSPDQIKKLDEVINTFCSNNSNNELNTSTKRFVEGIIHQRETLWGRASPETEIENDDRRSPDIQICETIFYTDDGKPYTVLDTLEEQVTSSDLESVSSTPNEAPSGIPVLPEGGDYDHHSINYYDLSHDKDDDDSLSDYDEEFERFLARKID